MGGAIILSLYPITRNRILWATRDNPSVRGIPKPKDEIKKNKGKKRGSYGSYNKKK